MTRTNTEVVSQLPTYSGKDSEDYPGWMIVTCGYEDCGGMFLVLKKLWVRRLVRKGTEITGRSCPYCFRVSHLPKRSRVR